MNTQRKRNRKRKKEMRLLREFREDIIKDSGGGEGEIFTRLNQPLVYWMRQKRKGTMKDHFQLPGLGNWVDDGGIH